MQVLVTFISVAFFVGQAAENLTELEKPQQIVANGKPIDVLREGQACPWFGDFDGDGLNDLLVGEAFGGRLRVYRNIGTKTAPRFGDYDWFRAGDEVARVPWALGGYKGFTPQLVDLDGDGKTDVVSGSYEPTEGWKNEFFWFRRLEGTKFAKATKLLAVDGKPIQLTGGAHPSFADWDGDGDIDLVIGTLEGAILLLTNEGSRTDARFAAPVPVLAAGKAIQAASQWAHPCVADWNMDGKPDLFVAALDGSVVLYLNQGKTKVPSFDSGTALIDKSPKEDKSQNGERNRPAMQPTLCVADFNGDGRLDLIVGDGTGTHERAELNSSQKEIDETEQNRAKLAEIRQDWSQRFKKYRELTGRDAVAERDKLVEINSRLTAAQADVEYDWPRYHMHGCVWVLLRKPAAE